MEYNDLSKPASAATRQIHQAMKTLLDFDDPHEKECALRNCLKKVENLEIKNAERRSNLESEKSPVWIRNRKWKRSTRACTATPG